MTKLSILGFVSTSDFLSLSRLQSSVPTLIGSSVRIFKERVASFATRFGILQKSNRFCKWRSKLFVFHFPKRCRFFTNRQHFLTCLRRCYRRRGRIMEGKTPLVKFCCGLFLPTTHPPLIFRQKKSVDVFFSGQPIRD